jgi:glyoxylase-like metal-dependent hydrolase (beta-lactamase superfamily II)
MKPVTDVARRPGDPDGASRPPKPKKQEQEPASEEIVEVAPGILRMQLPIWMPGLGHVNTYGLLDERGLAVVDPGLPGPQSWKALKTRLKSAGFKLRDIHTVVVTHSHPDHFGGAGRVAREARAELITHRAFTTWSLDRKTRKQQARLSRREAEQLERDAAAVAESVDVSPDELPTVAEVGDDDRDTGDPLLDDPTVERQRQSVPWGGETPWGGSKHPMPPFRRRVMIRALGMLFTPPDPTRRVRHGERVRLAGREWISLHTPGHTLDHLCLYDEEHGLLLAGDHVLPSITPHVSGVGNGADALRSYIATLDLVADLPGVRLGLPAHGHPFDDVPGRVEAIKRHHQERMDLLGAASAAIGPASVQELSHELFPKKHWGVMAESETFAHLEHLVLEGRAERHREHGKLIYTVAPAS